MKNRRLYFHGPDQASFSPAWRISLGPLHHCCFAICMSTWTNYEILICISHNNTSWRGFLCVTAIECRHNYICPEFADYYYGCLQSEVNKYRGQQLYLHNDNWFLIKDEWFEEAAHHTITEPTTARTHLRARFSWLWHFVGAAEATAVQPLQLAPCPKLLLSDLILEIYFIQCCHRSKAVNWSL